MNRAEALNIESTEPMEPMKLFEQLTLWLFLSLLLLGAGPTSAMVMRVIGSQLIASGSINEGDYAKFIQTITPSVRTVVFTNSPGGARQIGQDLAEEIRHRKLSTVALGYCYSSCANAFLGGVERRLANSQSFLGFHGNYTARRGWPSHRYGGEVATFYFEMTGGKLSDQMIELILNKQQRGFVAFYQQETRNCAGTEEKRPSGCPTLDVSALDAGILTDLSDAEVNVQ
jgi:hypothetical protein